LKAIARQGTAQHGSRHQEIAFRFASADHKVLFDREPH
jgi:hypothetical protein